MSQYIVDTSIVIQALITEKHTAQVRNLFSSLRSGDEVFVPQFCVLECTNVLWKHVRFQGMPQSTAESLVDDLAELPLTIYVGNDVLKRALEIGLKHQLAIYDSVYIALAEKLNHPLITDDVRQEEAAKQEGITIKPITDFTPET